MSKQCKNVTVADIFVFIFLFVAISSCDKLEIKYLDQRIESQELWWP